MIIESVEDFRKRYKGTYVFLNIRNENHLVLYEQDDGDAFSFKSPTFGDILVDQDCAMSRLSFVFPESGLYNIQGQCVEFNRNPARQWKRAPCTENTVFSHPPVAFGVRNPQIVLDMETAHELFFPKYPTNLDEAVKNPSPMMAVNKKFGVSLSPKEKDTRLLFWYRSEPIGFVDTLNKTIEIKTPNLLQETVDFIKKEAWEWTLINLT